MGKPEFKWSEKRPKKIGLNGKLGAEVKSKKAECNQHEEEIAEKLGGIRQPGSGSFLGKKGDIKLERFLLDLKETDLNSIVVTREMIVKATREANGDGKEPGLVLKFNKIAPSVPSEWVLLPLDIFAQMLLNQQDAKIEESIVKEDCTYETSPDLSIQEKDTRNDG